jgi:hypothetical protein
MAKRFIDTELFADEWFNELPKDAKLFFIYFITSCDHAGVLKLNKKLAEFQTGIKGIDTLVKDFGNSLVTLKEGVYWMPKFIKFQYPNFPKSNVRQQESALKILETHGIDIENLNTFLTLNKDFKKSSVSGSVTGLCLFKNSEFFDPPKFKAAFPDWGREKLNFYYGAILAWSNEGNMKKDWIATARTWANRDEKEGKIKFNVFSSSSVHDGIL